MAFQPFQKSHILEGILWGTKMNSGALDVQRDKMKSVQR